MFSTFIQPFSCYLLCFFLPCDLQNCSGGCSCIPGTISQDFRGSAPALGSVIWFITLAFPLGPQRDDPSRCCLGSLGNEVFQKPNTTT